MVSKADPGEREDENMKAERCWPSTVVHVDDLAQGDLFAFRSGEGFVVGMRTSEGDLLLSDTGTGSGGRMPQIHNGLILFQGIQFVHVIETGLEIAPLKPTLSDILGDAEFRGAYGCLLNRADGTLGILVPRHGMPAVIIDIETGAKIPEAGTYSVVHWRLTWRGRSGADDPIVLCEF